MYHCIDLVMISRVCSQTQENISYKSLLYKKLSQFKIVVAMCPARLTQWMSLLYGMLNKELKLWGSVQALQVQSLRIVNYNCLIYAYSVRKISG